MTRKVAPWQHDLNTDRGYASRVRRAQERGGHTPPGTKPNARDEAKVARKRAARWAVAE